MRYAVALLLLWPVFAQAQSIHDLCTEGVEGSYSGTIGDLNARVNLICVAPDHLVASVSEEWDPKRAPEVDVIASLSVAAIDGTDLVIANFLLGNDERRSDSSKSINAYLRVDLGALAQGYLRGSFMNRNLADFSATSLTRSENYPVSSSAGSFDQKVVRGSYVVKQSSWGVADIVFDVLDGTPVVYFRPRVTGESLRFIDGLQWDGSGVFSLITAEGNGGEPDDRRLFSIRGHFLSNEKIEFYLISPTHGLEGPLTAVRGKAAGIITSL